MSQSKEMNDHGQGDTSGTGLGQCSLLVDRGGCPITDDEIRIHAVTNETHGGTHRPSPLIRGLVKAVDAFEGDPTDDDLRRLAWEYYETVSVVRIVFEARRDVKNRRRDGNQLSGVRKDVWLDFEDAEIRELWEMRDPDEPITDVDARIAASLSALPGNVRRGVTRNAAAIRSRRGTIGATMTHKEAGKRGRRSS